MHTPCDLRLSAEARNYSASLTLCQPHRCPSSTREALTRTCITPWSHTPYRREPLFEIELKNILFATDFGLGAKREAAYAFRSPRNTGRELLSCT